MGSCRNQPVYVVVPDGLAADSTGVTLDRPSFIYRQVLDRVAGLAEPDSQVYLAPGNRFGGPLFEHEAGLRYLSAVGAPGKHRAPVFETGAYVDTFGNAAILKDYLRDRGLWPLAPVDLVCARLHSVRAEYCFRNAGYRIRRVHRVACVPAPAEPIIPRLWYYHHSRLHVIYELLALLRELARCLFIRKTRTWRPTW